MISMRKLIITSIIGICGLSAFAQTAGNPMTLLSGQCRELTRIENSINVKKEHLSQCSGRVEALKAEWVRICNDAMGNPGVTRQELDFLLENTAQSEDPELYSRLKAACEQFDDNAKHRQPDEPVAAPVATPAPADPVEDNKEKLMKNRDPENNEGGKERMEDLNRKETIKAISKKRI